MKVKVFEFSTAYWSWGWRVAGTDVENTLNQWMATNSAAQIRFIKHESLGGAWHPPQLIISIYYEESAAA